MTYNGNLIGDYFLTFYEENAKNIMYPPSPAGEYIYWLVGTANQKIEDAGNEFINNSSPIRCELDQLKFFANQIGATRGSSWTDTEWRLYICVLWYNIQTVRGIEYVLNGVLVSEDQQDLGERITATNGGGSYRISQDAATLELMSDKTEDMDLLEDITGAVITVPASIDPTPICWLKTTLNLAWMIEGC